LLDQGVIRPSAFPCGPPNIINMERSWRMCIDYCTLNKITINIIYPLPRIDDFLDQLQEEKLFTKLDLKLGYHQVRNKVEDVNIQNKERFV